MGKIFKVLFISLFFAGIAACGGGNSSSEDSAADVAVTTSGGVTVTFVSDEATVNEVFELFFNLGGDQLTGTIFWGDNTTTRVRGSGTVSHIYRGSGTVTIAIQIDGQVAEGVANITVLPAAPVEQPTESVSSPTQTTATPAPIPATLSIPTCTADFFGVGGSGFGNFQFDSLSGQVSSTDANANANLAGIIVYAGAILTSTTGTSETIFTTSETTDATGNFSRIIPVQSTVDTISNADFASVQTFFAFIPFSTFNIDTSISVCDSIDTDL